METDSTRSEALREAKLWFSLPERAPIYDAFQATFLCVPRKLFLETALHMAECPARRVLDVGCGTGEELAYLAARLPLAEIVGLEPATEMIRRAAERAGQSCRLAKATIHEYEDRAGSFDLVLSYSSFRFWDEPAAAIAKVASLLAPGGLAYIQDLRRDLDDDIRRQLVERMEGIAIGEFMAAQLDSAFSLAEISRIIDESGVRGCELRIGGLAGLPERSRQAFELIQQNERIASLLFQLPYTGFKAVRGGESVFHLFIRRDR